MRGICLLVPKATRKKKKKKKRNILGSYDVDTGTLRIVCLNLYKHCIFPCSIFSNVKGILASRGLMCQDAHVKTLHV